MGRIGLGSGAVLDRDSSNPAVSSGLPVFCLLVLALREDTGLEGGSPDCCTGAKSRGLTWPSCTGSKPMVPMGPAAASAELSTGTVGTAAGLAAGTATAELAALGRCGDAGTDMADPEMTAAGALVGVAGEWSRYCPSTEMVQTLVRNTPSKASGNCTGSAATPCTSCMCVFTASFPLSTKVPHVGQA